MQVYAIIRIDDVVNQKIFTENGWLFEPTVKEIVPTLEIAEAEVARLNMLARGDSKYVYQMTRIPFKYHEQFLRKFNNETISTIDDSRSH